MKIHLTATPRLMCSFIWKKPREMWTTKVTYSQDGVGNVVSCALGINCHFKTVDECFLVWLKQFPSKKKKVVTVGLSAVLWSIWKARNMACFQQVWPSDPSVILFQACYWIEFWSNLQMKEDVKLELRRGAKLLE